MTPAETREHLHRIEILAMRHMLANGLSGWSFRWGQARNQAGVCSYGTKTIGLSRRIMAGWSIARAEQTILHEIAHAKAGPGTHHGPKWAAECAKLGIEARRCWDPADADSPAPKPRYVGVCPAGHETERDRIPRELVSCGRCSPYRFDRSHLVAWKRNA